MVETRPIAMKDNIVLLACVGRFFSDIGHIETSYRIYAIKNGRKLWEFDAEGGITSMSIKYGIVIVGCQSEGWIYVLNLNTGEKIWELKIENDARVLIVDDMAVVSCYDGYIYALDLKEEKRMWEFKAESTVFTILSEDNIVVVACRKFNNNYASLYILDLETGKIIWEFKEEEHIEAIAIKDTILLVGCKDKVYAFDLNKII